MFCQRLNGKSQVKWEMSDNKSFSMAIFVLLGANIFSIGIVHADDTDRAIEKYRMGTIVVKTEPGVKVSLEQVRHEFWFGVAISGSAFNGGFSESDSRKYKQVILDNFNSAVHENALKWQNVEKQPGLLDYKDADKILRWCEDNGMPVRGHCVFWANKHYIQDWVKALDNEALRAGIESRANELLGCYKGRIDEYDVNNEMVHHHYYKDRLGEQIRWKMFDYCKKANPESILYVNDYDILGGNSLDDFVKHTESLINAGVPVGGIGLQGHFKREMVNAEKVKRVLDRVAKFNLPVKITEFDICTTDEEVKAKGLVDLYTLCFANPAVEGIMMWGFWEGSHWRPEAALWKKDWTETPAVKAYRQLVFDKWWTKWEGEADKKGVCRVPAFYGRHKVTVNGKEFSVNLSKKDGETTIDCRGSNNSVLQSTKTAACCPKAIANPIVTINGKPWKLAWAEEFNYTGRPNLKFWDYERLPPYKNGERQFYTDRLKNVRVENGKLVIEAHLEDWSGLNYHRDPQQREKKNALYTSGAINSRGRIAFLYGRIEMSAKMPSGGGVWPAFWAMGEKYGWPRCGEIDIMEYNGAKRPEEVKGTLHYSGYDEEEKKSVHRGRGCWGKIANPWEDFHTYAVEWMPEGIEFYIDGEKYWQTGTDLTRTKGNGDTNQFQQPVYLLLNLALGGMAGNVDNANLPQRYEVDYVRVYHRTDVEYEQKVKIADKLPEPDLSPPGEWEK